MTLDEPVTKCGESADESLRHTVKNDSRGGMMRENDNFPETLKHADAE